MLTSLHHICNFNFNTCQTLYNGSVLIKTCKYYILLRKCILCLLIILILSILTYIKMYIFYLSSFFIKIFHMFVLPDVVSASISGVQLLDIVLSIIHFCTELNETLNMILSYKS